MNCKKECSMEYIFTLHSKILPTWLLTFWVKLDSSLTQLGLDLDSTWTQLGLDQIEKHFSKEIILHPLWIYSLAGEAIWCLRATIFSTLLLTIIQLFYVGKLNCYAFLLLQKKTWNEEQTKLKKTICTFTTYLSTTTIYFINLKEVERSISGFSITTKHSSHFCTNIMYYYLESN